MVAFLIREFKDIAAATSKIACFWCTYSPLGHKIMYNIIIHDYRKSGYWEVCTLYNIKGIHHLLDEY